MSKKQELLAYKYIILEIKKYYEREEIIRKMDQETQDKYDTYFDEQFGYHIFISPVPS